MLPQGISAAMFGTRPDIVNSYEHPMLVRRLQNKLGLDEEKANQLFRDTLQFLYVCGTTDIKCVPTPVIDEGWHNFILFTRDYESFCRNNFGRMIHHNPIEGGGDPQDAKATIKAARAMFGDLSSNWQRDSADCNGDKCNGDLCSDQKCCSG